PGDFGGGPTQRWHRVHDLLMKQILAILVAIVALGGYSFARPKITEARKIAEYQSYYVHRARGRFSECNQLWHMILCTRGDGTHFYRIGTYWPKGAAKIYFAPVPHPENRNV